MYLPFFIALLVPGFFFSLFPSHAMMYEGTAGVHYRIELRSYRKVVPAAYFNVPLMKSTVLLLIIRYILKYVHVHSPF